MTTGMASTSIRVTSTGVRDGQDIPDKFAWKGGNVNPELAWTGVPAATKALAMIFIDPDAARKWGVDGFVHWSLYNMPLSVRSIAEDSTPQGATVGPNSFGQDRYVGPGPPPGETHNYYLNVYALDADLNLPPGLEGGDVLQRPQGHILAKGRLHGIFTTPAAR